MSDKKCEVLDHPNLAKGWGCCSCRTYNGDQRTECKSCQHSRCDELELSDEQISETLDSMVGRGLLTSKMVDGVKMYELTELGKLHRNNLIN